MTSYFFVFENTVRGAATASRIARSLHGIKLELLWEKMIRVVRGQRWIHRWPRTEYMQMWLKGVKARF